MGRAGGVVRTLFRCDTRRALCVSRDVIVRSLRSLVQCAADFLIADVCILCGRYAPAAVDPWGGVAEVRSAPGIAITSCLKRPVDQHLFGPIALRNHPICSSCADGLPVARWPGELGRLERGAVVLHLSGERFEYTAATGRYNRQYDNRLAIATVAPFMESDGTLRLIHLLKFSRYQALAGPMGLAMARALTRFGMHPGRDALLVPVPMTYRDQRIRGFNQAERLASTAGAGLRIPVGEVLVKLDRARRQSQTPRVRRAQNVRGVFHCRESLDGRPVILVDDLVTTGATSAACAAELARSGAGPIQVLCFARAL